MLTEILQQENSHNCPNTKGNQRSHTIHFYTQKFVHIHSLLLKKAYYKDFYIKYISIINPLKTNCLLHTYIK